MNSSQLQSRRDALAQKYQSDEQGAQQAVQHLQTQLAETRGRLLELDDQIAIAKQEEAAAADAAAIDADEVKPVEEAVN